MERRKEQRHKVDRPAKVTALGTDRAGSAVDGQILEIAGSGLRLTVPCPFEYNSPVRVDAQGVMMLGEVTRCEPDSGGAFILGVQLSHSFAALPELESLNQALHGEDPWSRLPAAPAKAE